LEGEFVAGGMGGDYTHPMRVAKPSSTKIARPLVEVQSGSRNLTADVRFAAFLQGVTES
jgi:hypothetical protein